MHAALPAALDSATLSRRLADLAGDERALQVEFLLHLEEYDRRRAYVEAGNASLWEFVTRALHYREGAAYRRITAMKALRRVPETAQALRSGALSLTTLALLEDVLTPENAADVMDRSTFKSKREVEQIVAALRPRPAPKEGLRRLSTAPPPATALPLASPPLAAPPPPALQAPSLPSEPRLAAPAPPRREVPATLEPVSGDTWSLRVTVDAALKEDLETLIGLLSHKLPKRELHEVVREAVRCAIEKHGKRKGAVEPARKRKASIEKPTRREPTAEVRRQVWKRDGGRCAWVGPDGKRCESTWQLEYDHVRPAALGGEASVANGRLLCRPHQLLSAEQTFGRAHMDKYRQRRGEREATSPGGSAAGIAPEGQPRDADLFPPGAPP